MVYLTADSEVELQDLNPQDVYIIGGIVDRNRFKGLTAKKAKENGLRTARSAGTITRTTTTQLLVS